MRRLRRRDRSTDIVARGVCIVGRNINGLNKNGLFSSDGRDNGEAQGADVT